MTAKTNKITNKDIAHLLRSVAAAYLIKNANRFKIIAYENAADGVEHLNRDIVDIWREGKLEEVPGIGKSICDHLDEYFKKGYSSYFNRIFKGIPDSVFELMNIPSLGPKKAYALVQSFNLKNAETAVDNLEKASLEGRVADLPRFGKRSQDSILRAIGVYKKRVVEKERMPLPYAFELAKEIIKYLKKDPDVKRADALGSLRRMVSTIGDIDIAVGVKSKDNYKKIIDHFIKFPKKTSIDNAGNNKASIIVSHQIRVDLRVQEEQSYGAMLQYFTGSKEHNIQLREFGLKKNLSLSEWGIQKFQANAQRVKATDKNSKLNKFEDEESFYRFLGMDYIPPEIREGTDEIDLALKSKLPKLIELKDIKGDLHVHSNYDLKPSHDFGVNNYSQILEKAHELKYEYVGFSEHNPKITDMSDEDITAIVKKRQSHINKIQDKSKMKCFIGLEVDILPNGLLALPEKAIEFLDYMIISVHSSFRLPVSDMTKRVLQVLEYPKVKILGHPTGRLLNRREGYDLDWKKIFESCKNKNIALEINSWPERLDLPDSLVREARAIGCKFVINTDSHANDQMENMIYGVSVARRGWCEKVDIINTKSYNEFNNWLIS